ncbi:MAG: branched-chain amino acid ABC transporter permease [Clostridia bacterium]|nr:branched-chain amino acid ABC transporter permease [Clostridia bacterium]
MKTRLQRLLPLVWAIALFGVILLLMVTKVLPRSYQQMLPTICTYIIMAVSLNLVVGFLGDLSLGHAAFYAIGAYVGGMILRYMTAIPFGLRMIVAIVAAAVVAFGVGAAFLYLVRKLRGDYLAIVTLAFGEFVRSIVKIIPGTGGSAGLTDIPTIAAGAFPAKYIKAFSWSYLVMILCIFFIVNLIRSRHGRAIMAVRDNAIAAASVGINVSRCRIVTFAIAALFAGIAGVLYAANTAAVNPADFDYNVSIEVLVMVVLGGMGNIGGSIIATIILVALPKILLDAAQYRLLIYAVALIAMMMLNANPRFVSFKRRVGEKLGAKFKSLRKGRA